MIVHSIFFYFFSVIAIFSSLMVITSRSTINSVFFLILDFISVGCLFIMVAEFWNDTFNCLCSCSSSFIFICCYDAQCCRAKQLVIVKNLLVYLPV